MLLELIVENYAVVERIRVRFGSGLNVLTGETGSGKSIVVDSLGLLFGARASSEMLRTGSDRARIAGIFEVPASAAAFLDEAGVEPEDGEILIERELLAGGKSRAFAASRPVTAAFLKDLAPWLGDIHGQHDQQQLFAEEQQLGLLDDYAKSQPLLDEVGRVYTDWRGTASAIAEIEKYEQEKLRLLDLWTFQRKEIEATSLKPGEDTALEAEKKILQNVTRLSDGLNASYSALYDAPGSAYSQIRAALRKIEDLTRVDEGLAAVLEALRPAQIAVDDASTVLRDYLGKLEADPDRLEQVETRLAAIEKLKRKYGGTVEEILVFLEGVRSQITSAETSTERRAELEKERAQLAARYEDLALKLRSLRQDAARKLEQQVSKELGSLAMERTVFRVEVTPGDWTSRGADRVRLLVSPNVGEEPKPLDKIASGGEISRIALALKTCVAGSSRARTPRTLVFDEVDAGIGGAAAESVGKRLKRLAASSQVLCVTHLAQIAGFADHHFTVEKSENKGRTVATIEELTGDTRTREISRMLSGRTTPESLKHAAQLIKSGATT